jgi:enolase-phosphatase E1
MGGELHRRFDRRGISKARLEIVEFRAAAALIDIEGTLGSIAFVRDVLFPYARERMDGYVEAHLNEPSMQALLADAAREAGVPAGDYDAILDALHRWSDNDVKITPLKELQGRIWVEGYESSGIRGHLYPDALDALRRFNAAGIDLYVYSSGSIAAQKLLFGHTIGGDVRGLFKGFYDTTIGGKRESASYRRIVGELGVEAAALIFFSDVVQELDAARSAGLQTVQLARPQDGTAPADEHNPIPSFEGIELRRP